MKSTVLMISIALWLGCMNPSNTPCNYIIDYYPIIYDAHLNYEAQDYKNAFSLYLEAFQSCDARNTANIYELNHFIKTSAILGHYDYTSEYLKVSISKGRELNSYQKDSIFSEFFSTKHGKELIKEYDDLRKDFLHGLNVDLRDEIINMRMADQIYRRNDHPLKHQKLDSIDTMHEKRLVDIFSSIGYPRPEIVGRHSRSSRVDITLLLLHTSDSIRMNFFVPRLKEFVRAGQASPLTLGQIIDQYHLYNGDPQIYGTYGGENGNRYAQMLKDENLVNKNRISIGLPTLRTQEKIDSFYNIRLGL